MSHFHTASSLQNGKFHLERSEPLQAWLLMPAWNVRGHLWGISQLLAADAASWPHHRGGLTGVTAEPLAAKEVEKEEE